MLKCYACGDEVDHANFSLISERDETDRVFIFCSECENQAREPGLLVRVGEISCE